MSDVSKTNAEVIDKNRKLWLDTRDVPVITTTKNGEANAIRWGWTEAKAVAAYALATRVPVQGEHSHAWDPETTPPRMTCGCDVVKQGEPNDDRTPEFEAIEQELFKHQPLLSMQDGSIRGCKCMDRVFVTKTEDWGTHLAEVFMRLPRATVPDAATEPGYYQEGIEEGIKIGRAERDAATAAIERIREAVSGHPECDRYSEDDVISCGWKSAYASVVAALDGAPEPDAAEKKYAIEYSSKTRTSIHEQESLESARVELARIPHPNGRIMQQVVSPWLPVEGETP